MCQREVRYLTFWNALHPPLFPCQVDFDQFLRLMEKKIQVPALTWFRPCVTGKCSSSSCDASVRMPRGLMRHLHVLARGRKPRMTTLRYSRCSEYLTQGSLAP